MATAALSSGSGIAGGLWAQIQQQQAQRNADQAEQKARTLQNQASEAQSQADRAQERARGLKVDASQAQNDAGEARRNVETLDSVTQTNSSLETLRGKVAEAVDTLTPKDAASTLAPVVNAYGQQTGTVINVSA